ncbi:cystatin-like protein [Cotesia glomerata]|uniref:Cystatin domain-containing protein n=1 Tax=Cotesia glomerata TaxID=32391 RepID=A0AAV7HYH6_COTGL|nr:cystatin-like protein [Cotesia glomerata]KAH0550264.1 hypothetical protein KQX54_018479 [Cotesia glomerata]
MLDQSSDPPKSGGIKKVSVDSPEVKNYAEQGLRKLSSTHGSTNELILTEIISATYQTVAGSLHKIHVKYGESNCPKGQFSEASTLAENSPIKECLISVWSRPWIKENPLEINIKLLED